MIHVQLTDEQRRDLRLRARREVGRVSERIHFVLLSDQGHSPPEIAELFGYCETVVRHWLKRYLAHGVEGLYDEPRSSRPPKMTETAQETLEEMVSQSPVRLGLWATVWTVSLLAMQLVPVVGSLLHGDTVRRHLHRLAVGPAQRCRLSYLPGQPTEAHVLYSPPGGKAGRCPCADPTGQGYAEFSPPRRARQVVGTDPADSRCAGR